MNTRKAAGIVLIAGVSASFPCWSVPVDAGLEAKTAGGITYVSGGIGEGQRDAMKRIAQDYNLRLTFVEKETGAYLADVKVLIEDANGHKILDAVSSGPLFYAKLPQQDYRISAIYDGVNQTKSARFGARPGIVELYYYWPN